jgi:NADH-quinone oxidoreductase subunit L
MPILNHLWIILLLPALGATLNGLAGKHWPRPLVHTVAIGSIAFSFVSVLELVREFLSLPAPSIPFVRSFLPWIQAGNFRVDFSFQVDQLTVLMLLIVTGVGLLIHIYSIGYMAHEGGSYRFFSYMNLFMFFMLTLVAGANLAVMFVGWEGVGLCSYLLIGFFFHKKSAADAGKKAFLTTRIGDIGFMIGIFLSWWVFQSLDYSIIFSKTALMPIETAGHLGVLTSICLLLFAGTVGKSAQLPLYVWLPDAMEGPTPVSALIHAATMVTAGVYMVARMNFVFVHAPAALFVVGLVGALTAFYAATIGLVQTDIKKVLAYSTISQLGYMFLACGVGAFSAGVFHLMTHAFFKGLLFLAAGSVIHAMGGEQDMRHMGGLRKQIPWTFATMLVATLAIAGIPGFSGFFSKDEILEAAQSGPHANQWLWALGIVAALLTSFYMFRLLFLTFFGLPRYDEHETHVHESPPSMLVPLIILALFALGGGWFAAPALLGGPNHFASFLHPVFAASEALTAQSAPLAVTEEAATFHYPDYNTLLHALTGLPVIVGLIGLLIAWWLYIRKPSAAEKLSESLSGPYTLLLHKYYVDEIYAALIISPLLWICRVVLWRGIDIMVIDGAVNGTAAASRGAGNLLRRLQSGNERSYATWVVVGAVAISALLLCRVLFWNMAPR